MQSSAKSFPCCKSMILNAIYDTLERLGIHVVYGNSEQGKLEFKANDSDLILAVETIYPQENVQVTLSSKSSDLDCGFADALFDEIDSTILATQKASS